MKKYYLRRWLLIIGLFLYSISGYAQNAESSSRDSDHFKVSVAYTGEFWGNLSGGTGIATRYLDNIDVNLEIDLGALPLGLPGTTVYLYGLGNQGGSISELAGDLQTISNIESHNSWRIYEIWAQKKFFLAHSSILAGLYDINSEFNVLNSSLLFINSSHGIDPSIALSGEFGPSIFPYTSLGTRIKINPVGGWVLQAAMLDGVPSNPANPDGTKVFLRDGDGLLFLAELGIYSVGHENIQFRNRTARLQHLLGREVGGSRYKFAVGGWAYSQKREGWMPDENNERDMGLYGLGEFRVYKEEQTLNQGLTIFGRASIANEKINRLAGYLGGGLVYHGLIKGRDNDEVGIAVAHAINSADLMNRRGATISGRSGDRAETNIELTYLTVITSSVSLQGDVQYIINPNMDPDINNALAAGVRLLLSF